MTRSLPQRIIVVGGGYAGILCANRLAGKLRSRAKITLINPRDSFVERIRLHEVAARTQAEPATRRTIRSLLKPSVELRLGEVTRIRPQHRRIDAVDMSSLDPWTAQYDKLVYAVGSGVPFASVPGAAEHAHSISSLEGAHALRDRLAELDEDARVVVVGGGATAIELVTELAALRPRLRLSLATSSQLAPTLSAKARAYVANARAMTRVRVFERTRVSEVTPTGIRTADGGQINADCVVWAASFAVPTLARDSGLEVDSSGRLIVDAHMQAANQPDILGAGDAVFVEGPSGESLRMACATAVPQGAHAAATIIAHVERRPPEAFGLAYLVLALSLGPGDGVVQRTRFDDVPTSTVLRGLPAAAFNEWNNRYARSILAGERARAGTYRWVKPPRAPGRA